MEREKIIQERIIWYHNVPTLFEMIKCLKHKELCFITKKGEEERKVIRYLTAFKVDFLQNLFNNTYYLFWDKLINLYHSTSTLKRYPYFNLNPEKRYNQEYNDFNNNYESYISSYDYFIDIDGKENFELAYKEAKKLKRIFDSYKLPYYLINSSSNGFHFIIPSSYMPDYEINKLLEIIQENINALIKTYNLKTLDDSIVDFKRVKKLPYSYECSGVVCLPLDNKQFSKFNTSLVSMENVLKMNIRDRGLLIRTHNLTDEQLKKNVEEFLV